jgi:hypothetical protein
MGQYYWNELFYDLFEVGSERRIFGLFGMHVGMNGLNTFTSNPLI